MKIIVSQAALADLARLHSFLAGSSPTAARRAVAVLTAAIQSLEVFPERGRPSGSSKLRELIVPFGRGSYVIRYAYRQQSDEVVILRIWHSREARE
jgi:plasmid stabilization system protein ParE